MDLLVVEDNMPVGEIRPLIFSNDPVLRIAVERQGEVKLSTLLNKIRQNPAISVSSDQNIWIVSVYSRPNKSTVKTAFMKKADCHSPCVPNSLTIQAQVMTADI